MKKNPDFTTQGLAPLAKKIMEGKFGKGYDKPKQGALSSSAAKGIKAHPHYDDEHKAKRMPDGASAKIEVLSKQNPHKPGSNRADAFMHVLKSKNVATYLNGGAHCKHKYLAAWVKEKLIKLV